jgi:hypothetical protein
MAEPVPPWFRGPPPPDDPLTRACGQCGAPPGERCRYTSAGGIHRDADTWLYVDNVIGQPMQRSHKGR